MAKKSRGYKSSRFGAIGFTFLALMLTGLTAFLLAQVLKKQNISATPMKRVVVAKQDIKASELIKPEYFKEVRMPMNAIPGGYYSSIDQLFTDRSKPRVFVNAVYENEVILPQRLSDPKRGTGFASLVSRDFRALSLEVDGRTTRANVVYPGAYVDILTTMKRIDSKDFLTRLVVQGVKVLAVNGISDSAELEEVKRKSKRRSRRDVLTILVTPDQGEALTLAANEGKIDVLLRNANDEGSIETEGVTTKELTVTAGEEPEVKKGKGRRRSRNRFRRRVKSRDRSSDRSRKGSSTTTIEF